MVEREIEAVQLATADDLTLLLNRRGFRFLAQHSLHHLVREELSGSLVFIDLDNLKTINDCFGHAEGDKALTLFAKQLMLASRRDWDIVARIGGDEFVMLQNDSSRIKATDVVLDLIKSLEACNQADERPYDISFSYGIVEFDSERHLSIDDMLCDGDSMMYELKRSKR